MKFINKFLLTTSLACGLAMTAGTVAAKTFKWDLTNDYQASSLSGQMDKRFAEQVQELTDGQVRINVHLGGSLGYKSADALDAVETGAIQIADSSSSFWGGINPLFKLTSIPFLVSSYDEAQRLYEIARPEYEEALLDRNQILLYAIPWAPSGLWTRKPIDSLEDLKNLRIRTYDPNGITSMRALGASPVQTSIGEVMPMLATNALDGVLTAAEGGTVLNFWEELPHFTAINYAMSLQIATLNRDAFEELPADLQEAVLQAAKEVEDFGWEELEAREVATYELMEDEGVTIQTEIAPEFLDSLREAGASILQSWVEETGENGQKIIEAFEAEREQN